MHSLPKIFPLETKYVDDIFKGPVEITEKIDGSQFRFCLNKDRELLTYSRGGQIYPETADKLFKPVLNWVHSVQHKLIPGAVYYGETLANPRHNVLAYNSVPKNHFCLFGISTQENTTFNSWEGLEAVSFMLDCDVIPRLFQGVVSDTSDLNQLVEKYLDIESYLGGPKIEGIVIKNYNQTARIGDVIMPIMCAKYVSASFKEQHKHNPEYAPRADQIQLIFNQYKTDARWNKSIQHLNEAGELEGTPRDIGRLLKEINSDIVTESKEEIMEQLWKVLHKQYQGVWTRGFAEYYKRHLLNGETNE